MKPMFWSLVEKRLSFLRLEKKKNRILAGACISFVMLLLFLCTIPAIESASDIENELAVQGAISVSNQNDNLDKIADLALASSPDAALWHLSELSSAAVPESGESELIVYFIDVGQADSALLLCDGMSMLIDGGNAADSSLIYTFLRDRGINHLDYIVATHAHEDHVGGLAGALNYATASVAYSPVTSYDTGAYESFVKYLDQQGLSITVPKHGDSFWLGGSKVEIIGPIKPSKEPNNTSIIMRVTHGEINFLFMGDAEREEEQDILEAGYELSATVLKVGHHGSDTSTTYPFLREIMPQYAVISCGSGNVYGHPQENLLSRLRDADVALYRTDMQGDIVCVSDGKTVSFTTNRNASAQTNPTAPSKTEDSAPTANQEASADTSAPASEQSDVPEPSLKPSANAGEYIGNRNTKKFHKTTCRTLPAEHNQVYLISKDVAISEGYDPCGNCKP
jgi:competence protein ComEC